MRKLKNNNQKQIIDRTLFLVALSLTLIGLVAVADASAPIAVSNFSDKYYFAKQQAVWGAIGLIFMIVVSKIKYSYWSKLAIPLLAGSLVLLVLVLIPGLGSKVLGARRWIIVGPVSIQPSEIIKLALAVYFAKVAASSKRIFSYLIPLGTIGFLIMLQPDLGTTLVVSAIGFSQMFVGGVKLLYFAASAGVGGLISFILVVTSEYRKQRLLTFFQQTQDPLGKGYHIRQVLYALGSGGIFGVGLGKSRQKYLFLPEATSDSIFAIIAEETGILGATVLILLFVFFILKGLKIARNSSDKFAQVLAVGLVAWIGGQAFLNLGSMVALVPLTGIPLPFVSYGGSSLVTVMVATGILLNISRYVQKQK